MNLASYNLKEINELLALTDLLLLNQTIFNPNFPLTDIEFEIRSRLSIFKYAHDCSGYPDTIAVTKYYFNYKIWFEKLHIEGVVEINNDSRKLCFLNWKIKTNRQSIIDLKNEIVKFLKIKTLQENQNLMEIVVRDAINNNRALNYPTLNKGDFNFSNHGQLTMLNKTLSDCGECDIVCSKDNVIKYIVEITTGAITLDFPNRRILSRKKVAPEGVIWVIGSRINANVLQKLTEQNIYVSRLKDLKQKYPNVFNLVNC